ncbi:hypothetical protein B0J12DRAFT_553844, partial [Macrophomina phaseolina]
SAHFEQIPAFGLVACRKCRHAVWPDAVGAHLRGGEHRMSRRQAQAVSDKLIELWGDRLLRRPAELEVPASVEAAIPQLPIFPDGLLCEVESDRCRFVCRNENRIRNHCRDAHGWTKQGRGGRPSKADQLRAAGKEPWRRGVRCQRFFPSRHASQFFAVMMER